MVLKFWQLAMRGLLVYWFLHAIMPVQQPTLYALSKHRVCVVVWPSNLTFCWSCQSRVGKLVDLS